MTGPTYMDGNLVGKVLVSKDLVLPHAGDYFIRAREVYSTGKAFVRTKMNTCFLTYTMSISNERSYSILLIGKECFFSAIPCLFACNTNYESLCIFDRIFLPNLSASCSIFSALETYFDQN